MFLTVGIVGAGNMGRRHAQCWQRIAGARIAKVADLQNDKAQSLARSLGDSPPAVDATNDALFADPEITVVSICTPTDTHRALVEAACAAGKHVLCEKPMALSVADCDAMIAAAEKAKVLLTIGQVVRFFPEYEKAYRLVHNGAVGTPAAVRTRRGGDFPRTDSDWYASVPQSGGVIFDLLIHDIDWLLWCFGPVTRVFAKGLTERLSTKKLDPLDYALLTLRHESGVISHVEGTWADPGGFVTTFEIAGDQGMLTHDSRKTQSLRTAQRGTSDKNAQAATGASPLADSDDPYYRQIAAFAASITDGLPLAVLPDEARNAVRVAAAARESLQTGKAISLEERENP